MKRFLVNQWRRETRQKRGGGRATVPLEGNEAACVTAETPVRIAELRELREAMGVALQRLRRQCEAEGDGERFDQLSAFLVPGEAVPDGEAVAGRLGMNSGALRVAVHRLRKRYGQMCVDVDLGDLAPVGAARSRRQQVDDLLGIVSQC